MNQEDFKKLLDEALDPIKETLRDLGNLTSFRGNYLKYNQLISSPSPKTLKLLFLIMLN